MRAGSAARHPDTDTSAVNTALLDTGDYRTTPSKPLGLAGSVLAGQRVEAHRMAEVVLRPAEIDPMLTRMMAAEPFIDGGVALDRLLPGTANVEIIDALNHHEFIAGFATGGSTVYFAKPNTLKSFVVRFADPADATAAADEMADHSEREPENRKLARRPHQLPEYPETRAFLGGLPKLPELVAYTVYGPYLLIQLVAAESRDEAVRLISATLGKQRPALDDFAATPQNQLAELPLDPSGLLARTLPPPASLATVDRIGSYGPRGMLHFSNEPVADQELFAEAGVTEQAQMLTTVYAARDPDGAARVAEGFVKQVSSDAESSLSPDAPPAGMPGAWCFKPQEGAPPSVEFRCLTTAGRYVVDAEAPTAPEVRRMLAAQYLMLVR
ncbi:hypothetical protein A5643_00905 [Mycobacterium sp. 1274756.6]|nr:hypothetical protein A5643_00905 [Mycobacterium sp. 1274756.6]